jgi:integrase
MEDRRHPRRAATDKEICRLLGAVPEYRRYVYMTAVMTGLRRGELGKIERRNIDLDKKTLRVRAEVSKNGEEAKVPLHDEMVARFRDKIVLLGAADRIFETTPNNLTFQRDVKKAGIAYKDENGRYFDFHALRSTFATRLLRNDISLSKAIRLTRHKSVKTLEVHYDMLGLSDAEEAMDQLPGLGLDENGGADEPSQ